MRFDAPFVLLDDARPGGSPARLYTRPHRVVAAHDLADVPAALAAVREGARGGLHAAGFLSYDAAAAFEPRSGVAPTGAPARATPLAWFGLFDGYRALDDVAALLPDPAGCWIGPLQPEVSYDTYQAMFAQVMALIAAGDLYQANLSFRATVPLMGDPLSVYARLRGATRAGWGGVVATGEHMLLSFSPELFFTLEQDRLTCRPMKGTARRVGDPAADAAAATALASDPKQRAENLMIVDLMRNDLSRVARAGSVAVPALFTVEHYPSVHQLTSTVTATLAPGQDAVDVLGALFPCGSITGAPKIRAMQALGHVERSARGVYTGAIGRVDAGGGAAFNVAIRTLTIATADPSSATLGIGGGIVADSTGAAEWDEALAKAAFLRHGHAMFDVIETMAFDPLDGMPLVERHLARMKDSAAELGFAFDRHAARNELQAATFRLRRAARVRLLLAASGAIAIEVGEMPPAPGAPLRVVARALPVQRTDVRLHHKTSDRDFYDAPRRASGADEVVFTTPDGWLTEGSFTSIFVERGGLLETPAACNGLLPGVLRAELIDTRRAVEADLTLADLAGGFLLGNALRGLMPATLVSDASMVAR